jgi:hypothetical protein
MDRRGLVEVADAFIPGVPVSQNDEYIRRIKEVLGPWQDELGAEIVAIRAAEVAAEGK